MTILVIGGTGMVGSPLPDRLALEDGEISAPTRNSASATLPDGVIPVQGNMLDGDATRAAPDGVDRLSRGSYRPADLRTDEHRQGRQR